MCLTNESLLYSLRSLRTRTEYGVDRILHNHVISIHGDHHYQISVYIYVSECLILEQKNPKK